MYKSGEGTCVDYEKDIHHFSIYANKFESSKVHWELARIFESAKGCTDADRALYHQRIIADVYHRNDEAANYRVAEYF